MKLLAVPSLKIRSLSLATGIMLLATGCGQDSENNQSSVLEDDSTKSSLFIKLGEDLGDDSFKILISSDLLPSSINYCEDVGTACAAEARATKLLKKTDTRKFFIAEDAVTLADGLSLRFEASDADKLLTSLRIKISKKGDVVTAEVADYDWRADINLVDVATTSYNENSYGSSHYKDVMTHTKNPFLNDSPLTNVHESQHFMLHENDGRTPEADKFIYYGGGKGAFFLEPTTKTSVLATYIPSSMPKTSLHNTYIVKRPTQVMGENIFDEWTAYISETVSLIEATNAGSAMRNDSVEGAVAEFMMYCAAGMTAILDKEPAHLEKPNVKAIFAMHAERVSKIREDLESNDALKHTRTVEVMEYLKSHADAQKIRDALKTIYGATWTQRVLGF